MNRIWNRAGIATSITAITAVSVLFCGGVAYADNIQDSITGSGAVTLVAGSTTGGSATIRLVGNAAAQDNDPGCNIDPGDSPLTLTVNTPAGVTATPNPVAITSCGTDFPVSFTASSTAVSGTVTVTVLSGPAGGGSYVNQVNIPITITQPVVTNTKPSVSVGGVTNGASYEIGSEPIATCLVVDAEDGNSTSAASVSGELVHGLGALTATCDYTDAGGKQATTATATYTIVDTVDPTIEFTLNPVSPDGTNGWYRTDAGVVVHFTCTDVGGSGIAECPADEILFDGADHSVTGTATDNAGNTATVTASGITVDTVDPTILYTLNPAEANGDNGWYTTGVSVGFTCADAGGSGILEEGGCVGDKTLGDGADQSVTGTATDRAGNTATATVSGINIDSVGPTILYTLNPVEGNGASGWYTSDVDVDFTCTDVGGSGIADCPDDTTLTDGAHQVTGTATDNAGNASEAIVTVVNIDSVGPTISYTLNPAEANGASGWYTSDVDVDFTCTDVGGSGIAQCPADTTLTDGAHQVTGTATDNAGNATEAIATAVNIDSVDPTIVYTLSPATPDGINGWYTTDAGVVVDFSCTDVGGSGIANCPADRTLRDGADQSVTGTATDNAGNAAEAIATVVNIDSVDPTIEYTLSPAKPNGLNGWYTTDAGVVVDFTCTDDGSGIAGCPADRTLRDGADQSVTGTATDIAGNTTTVTTSWVSIDSVDPTIEYTLSPATPDGLNGWYTTDAGVVVDFTCTDVGGSGIANCPADRTLRDGANQSVTGTATDNAGNAAEAIATVVNIDSVDPTIEYALDPADANDAGWYATNVIVDFTCEDTGGSGILEEGGCAGSETLVEGEGQSVTGTATDRAGNTATVTASGVNIDKTAPTVALLGGPTGSYYYGNDPAAPTCDATDALSGLASCVVSGGGTAVGTHTYTATATDNAGNTSTSTLDYTVRAWHLTGFYSPVDMGANTWNTVKGGSTVPLKFEIFAAAELTNTSAVKSFTATTVTCPGAAASMDAIEFTTTGGTSLRYDSTSGQFIQNWATPKKPGACVKVTMTAHDGSSISANFILK